MKKVNSFQSSKRINNIYQKQQMIIESQELQIHQMEEEIIKMKDSNQLEIQNKSIKREVSGLHELIAAIQKEKMALLNEKKLLKKI